MTGQHTGHTPIRGNDEWKERGDTWNYQAMFDNPFLEGQRPIPDSTITIAEVLKSAGYSTGMVGKWGLGAPTTEGLPNKQGFDFFYGYNCQRQAHTLYPMHLWRNDERHLLNNKNVPPHANLEDNADINDPFSYNVSIVNINHKPKFKSQNEKKDVVHSVSFDIPKAKTVALVGAVSYTHLTLPTKA